ncbi:MAG: hypothetical protein IPJ19_02500 [Planctomycetes bacterium]|nr:hypothetical protein [Planctomycetota bacterium]
MQTRILSLVALAALSPIGWTQASATARPDLDAALGAWRATNGSTWNYALDPETGWAQMVYGGHTQAPAAAPRNDAEFAARALELAPLAASLHGLDASTLSFQDTTFLPLGQVGSGDKQTVRLRQSVNGIQVEGAFLNLLFSASGELLSVQSSGLPDTASIDSQPVIDAGDAAAFARTAFFDATNFEALQTGAPELLIAQIRVDGSRRGRLAYKVECNWSSADAEPLRKLVYVDALDGKILRMDEGIQHFDVGGNVTAMASPGLAPDIASNPETAQVIKYGRCQAGATTVYTDASGHFNFPGLNVNTNVTFTFVGTYASVNYSPGADYSLVLSLPPGTSNAALLNPSSAATVTPQANAYIVSTMMRDWIRGINPTDSHGDFVTVANTNVAGTCNAYYNGSSINFFPAGGGCNNTAYSTVITHEQGHWMNDRYSTGNGNDGMGEGNADVWAMYMWDTPIVGQNFAGSSFIRTGNNNRQFCGDCCGGCYGEVHNDGEVWMGAAWKVRNNLNTVLGGTQGDLTANALFLGWMNAYNQTQIKSIIETQWMTLDDDDGNISNGTPHFTPIDSGFRTQGFPGLTVSCPSPTSVCLSSINSTGGEALMGYAGSNDISNNDLVLNAIGLPANKTGLFFFGQNQTLVPFGNGWRCVGNPLYRLPATSSNMFGDLVWTLDLNTLPSGVQIHSGETWYFQAWYRDPAAGGAFYNASDALQVPWCP